MIVKMKFLSISGPKTDIDRVCDQYLSKYEMQLENAVAELKTNGQSAAICRFESLPGTAREGGAVYGNDQG